MISNIHFRPNSSKISALLTFYFLKAIFGSCQPLAYIIAFFLYAIISVQPNPLPKISFISIT